MSEDYKFMDTVITKRELLEAISKYKISVSPNAIENQRCVPLVNRIGERYQSIKDLYFKTQDKIDYYIRNGTIRTKVINKYTDEFKKLQTENTLLRVELGKLESFSKLEGEYREIKSKMAKSYQHEVMKLIDERQQLLYDLNFYKEEYKKNLDDNKNAKQTEGKENHDTIFKEKDGYRLLRLQKRIKLKEIADYVGCAMSTISRFENEKNRYMSGDKVIRYKEYIDNF